MKVGIVERIKEGRRIAAAAELAQRYRGIGLMSSLEAVALHAEDDCARAAKTCVERA